MHVSGLLVAPRRLDFAFEFMHNAFYFVFAFCFEQAGRSKRRRAMVPFEPGESVSAKVVLAKPDAKWAVASTTDGRLLVVQVNILSQSRSSLPCPVCSVCRFRLFCIDSKVVVSLWC